MKVLLAALLALVAAAPAQRGTPRSQGQRPAPAEGRGARRDRAGDRTARGAPTRARMEEAFLVCDRDSDGRIAFREARESLSITRAGFGRFDTDRDGLIDLEEFVERYTAALVYGDALPSPLPDAGDPPPPLRDAVQLRLAFDADADGVLDLDEVTEALRVYDRETLDPRDTVERLDVDNSGRLELAELEGFAPLLFGKDSLRLVEREDDPTRPVRAPESAASILDLFGGRETRESSTKAAPLPPRIAGPLDHFHRLDLDSNGVLTVSDLDGLLRPIQSSIRLHAVVAVLDRNEDGQVTPEEFWASMED